MSQNFCLRLEEAAAVKYAGANLPHQSSMRLQPNFPEVNSFSLVLKATPLETQSTWTFQTPNSHCGLTKSRRDRIQLPYAVTMNDAHKAQAALEAKDYPAAIALLTSALKSSQSPLWLIQRSTAYQRNNQHELALADADNAVRAARNRGKRELIATAHLRRAIALNALGRYGDARLCLIWTTKFNEKEKGTTLWMSKNKQDYDRAGGDQAECNRITVKEIPDEVEEATSTKEKLPQEEKKVDKGKGIAGLAAAAATPAVALTHTPKEKIRQEWYQSTNTVTIEIFAKGIPKENAEVDIGETSVSRLRVAFVQNLD